MPEDLNFDLKLGLSPDPSLDQKTYDELQRIYTSVRILARQVAGGNMQRWQDIDAADLDVNGWSVFTTKGLTYRYLNIDTVLVSFSFDGTSNSTLVDFELPVASADTAEITGGAFRDNGAFVSTPGLILLTEGSRIAVIHPDSAGTAWTASGVKTVWGQFIYRV